MGSRISKDNLEKIRPEPAAIVGPPPAENGAPPQLNHTVLVGRASRSTVVEGAVMVELSLKREEGPGASDGYGPSAPHSPSSPEDPDPLQPDATSGFRVRRTPKRIKSATLTIQANVLPSADRVVSDSGPVPVVRLLNYSVQTLLGRPGRIRVAKLSPDETQLLVASSEETCLVLYDLLAGGLELLQFNGHSDQVMAACFAPDGKFVCSTSRDKTAILWDTSTAKQVQVMGHDALMMCCDYSPDGQYIAAGCIDRVCKVWEAKSGKSILNLSLHTSMVVAVAFSPDASSVCSAGADKTLMVWDVVTGRRRFTLSGHTGPVLSCAFSNDELRLLSNDEKTIRLWSPQDGRLLETWGLDARVPCRKTAQPMPGNRPEMKYITATFGPGPHIVASVNNKVVVVLDPNSGQEVLSLFFRASVYCLGSGPSNTIAMGDANGNVHILRLVLETDRTALPPRGPRGVPPDAGPDEE